MGGYPPAANALLPLNLDLLDTRHWTLAMLVGMIYGVTGSSTKKLIIIHLKESNV